MAFGRSRGLTPSWRRMLAPARYLRVRHPGKVAFDYGWPAALTITTVAAFYFLPVRPAILGGDGFLKSLHDLIGLLAAFFVAALAAVSTVERRALDAPMLGTPPTLCDKALSRRQFVCLLFGYLSLLAFGLYLAAIAAEMMAPSLRASLTTEHMAWARTALGAVFAFWFWNMGTTTALGIWFLVDRVPMTLPEADHGAIIAAMVVKPSWTPENEPSETKPL